MNRDYEAQLLFRSGFRLGMQLAAEALTSPPELYEELGAPIAQHI